MKIPEGYDPETLEYVGPCPTCGTDHGGGGGPETLGGQYACIGVQARAVGGSVLSDWKALGRKIERARNEIIARYLRS